MPDPVKALTEELPVFVQHILVMGRSRLALAGGSIVGVVGRFVTPGNDYDLFTYGIGGSEATGLLEDILRLPGVSIAARTGNAVTIMYKESPESKMISIQIILRLYRSVSHIVSSFDLPPCKIVAFMEDSGLQLLATASWMSAMRSMSFWIDEEAWSTSTAYRLIKYYTRGFDVVLPGLRRHMIKGKIRTTALKSLKGISQLYALEHFLLQKHHRNINNWKLSWKIRRGVPSAARISPTVLQSVTPLLHSSAMCDYASIFSPLIGDMKWMLKTVLRTGKKWLGLRSSQGIDVELTPENVCMHVDWLPNSIAGSLHTCEIKLEDCIDFDKTV